MLSNLFERERMKYLICIVVLAALFVAGCNTVSGIGRDMTAIAEGTRAEMAK